MRINQLGEKNSFYNHKHTEETKKQISNSLTGEKHPKAKKVMCVETKDIFNTLTEAALWCSGNSNMRGKISMVCQGKRQHAGKHPITLQPLSWRYI